MGGVYRIPYWYRQPAQGIAAIAPESPPVYTLTGPASGVVAVASTTFTVTPSLLVTSDTVTIVLSGVPGGSTSVASLTWNNSVAPQTFTYTPSAAGAETITLTSGAGYTITNSPATYTATAITYTLSGPTSGRAGVASTNFTATPSAAVSDTVTIGIAGTAGGSTSVASLTWAASAAAKTFTYTPASAGAETITLTSGAGYTVTGSPATYASSAGMATTATLSGPFGGHNHVASTNFTVALDGSYTGTITPSDAGSGGTFAPASLSGPGTFTYTPASLGTVSISITASPALSYSGSPISYLVSPYVTAVSPGPGVRAAVSTVVTATFDSPMASATIGNSSFTLYHGSTQIAGIVTYNAPSRTATFTPGVNLAAGAAFQATLTTAITSSFASVPLVAPVVWIFSTPGAPRRRWIPSLGRMQRRLATRA